MVQVVRTKNRKDHMLDTDGETYFIIQELVMYWINILYNEILWIYPEVSQGE